MGVLEKSWIFLSVREREPWFTHRLRTLVCVMCMCVKVVSQDVGSALPEAATLSFHEALQVRSKRNRLIYCAELPPRNFVKIFLSSS